MTRPWTEQEVHRLRVLAKKKASADHIAQSLDRHVGSVKRKARELSLILLKTGEGEMIIRLPGQRCGSDVARLGVIAKAARAMLMRRTN